MPLKSKDSIVRGITTPCTAGGLIVTYLKSLPLYTRCSEHIMETAPPLQPLTPLCISQGFDWQITFRWKHQIFHHLITYERNRNGHHYSISTRRPFFHSSMENRFYPSLSIEIQWAMKNSAVKCAQMLYEFFFFFQNGEEWH